MINQKSPKYFSTTGLTPPLELTALSEPNYSSKALLESAPEVNDDEVMIDYD